MTADALIITLTNALRHARETQRRIDTFGVWVGEDPGDRYDYEREEVVEIPPLENMLQRAIELEQAAGAILEALR